MSPKTVATITEQVRLCEQATLAFKAYHEAKGMVSAEDLERLRLKAEFHYGAINDYLLRCRQGTQEDSH